jgi:hypothetical protein
MRESGRLDPDLAQQAIEYCYQQDSAAMKGEGEVGGGFSRILPSRQHVPVVVAGARNAAISMVVRVFGLWSGTAVGVQ